jgi:hypothetical protein
MGEVNKILYTTTLLLHTNLDSKSATGFNFFLFFQKKLGHFLPRELTST